MARTLILGILAALAVAPAASAQAPVTNTYGGQGANVVGTTAPSASAPAAQTPASPAAPAAESDSVGSPSDEASGEAPASSERPATQRDATGSAGNSAPVSAAVPLTEAAPAEGLPFTGLDLAIIAGGGLALLMLGVGMRRLASMAPRAH
jgi:hypothetical protein